MEFLSILRPYLLSMPILDELHQVTISIALLKKKKKTNKKHAQTLGSSYQI